MEKKQDSCCNCIWYDKCLAAGVCEPGCDDHTSMGDEVETTHYRSILDENADEYRLMVEEYADG